MRVLFDHNVPHKLRHFLSGHEIRTADEMGWAGLENGQLLSTAERAGFAVMISADKNLSYQENLRGRRLALIILSTNNWNVIKLHPQRVATAVAAAQANSFQVVTF